MCTARCYRYIYLLIPLGWLIGAGFLFDDLVIALDDGVQRGIELVGRLEEGELDDEKVLEDLATELRDELSSSLGRTTYTSVGLIYRLSMWRITYRWQ